MKALMSRCSSDLIRFLEDDILSWIKDEGVDEQMLK